MIESFLGAILVDGEIDIHELKDKLGRVHLWGHGKSSRAKVWSYSIDATKVVRLSTGEKEQFIEELEC